MIPYRLVLLNSMLQMVNAPQLEFSYAFNKTIEK